MHCDGWEFAVERVCNGGFDLVNVVAKHRASLMCLVMTGRFRELERAASGLMFDQPTLGVVRFSASDQRLVQVGFDMAQLRRVSMEPDYSEVRVESKSLRDIGVFRPWVPGGEEIIVEPKTVAGLLEEIRSLQQPELAEVRRSNAMRDARERVAGGEKTVAQIIAFAA